MFSKDLLAASAASTDEIDSAHGVFVLVSGNAPIIERWSHPFLEQTSHAAELHAILRAAQVAKERGLKLKLVTNNEYILGVLQGRYSARKNSEVIAEIFEVMETSEVEFGKPGSEQELALKRCASALAALSSAEAEVSSGFDAGACHQ